MRYPMATSALVILLGAAVAASAFGQAQPPRQQQPATGQQAPKQEQPARQYIKVSADDLNRFAPRFDASYVQVADYFSEMIPADQYPRELQPTITPAGYFLFRTQKAIGSNMLCIAPRSVKAISDFFQNPVVPDTRIYLYGRVGPRVMMGDGPITIFYVENIIRGHVPPDESATSTKEAKPVTIIMEWEAGSTVLKREYSIPEPNKRYRIPDPHDPTKDIYVTLQY